MAPAPLPQSTGERSHVPPHEAFPTDDLYAYRFAEREHVAKDAAWTAVVGYLSRWIDPGAPVLDVGCDRGYFIRHVRAVERWGVDQRDVSRDVGADVTFVRGDGTLADLPQAHFGTIFMSNYLEHLPNSHAVIDQLSAARRLLAPGGRVIVLQPNIRLTKAAYWDFIDHHVALTERSLVEATQLAGLQTERLIVRFLPYTTKGRLPVDSRLVRLYLRLPLAWRFLGQQTLWIGGAAGPALQDARGAG